MAIGSSGVGGTASRASDHDRLWDLLDVIKDPNKFSKALGDITQSRERLENERVRLEAAIEKRAKIDDVDRLLEKTREAEAEAQALLKDAKAKSNDILSDARRQIDEQVLAAREDIKKRQAACKKREDAVKEKESKIDSVAEDAANEVARHKRAADAAERALEDANRVRADFEERAKALKKIAGL
jgi:chromosome segregation ATPase